MTSGVDTISNFPCNILDGILGCLPLKDAVKTSRLSKAWRYKWVTRQNLEFDDQFSNSLAHYQDVKTIIYQILLLHKGSILKFRLRDYDLIGFRDIDHWIRFLSNKSVQEFTLLRYSGYYYQLPSHLFACQHLRHLEVEDCLFYPPIGFKGFEMLVNLYLHTVTFLPATLRNIISRCPSLESLSLIWCKGFDTVEIDAANLKQFVFRGTSKSICFKNAPMLRKVNLWIDSRVPNDPSLVSSNLTKFFCYMPCLMELDISRCLLEPLTMGGLPGNPMTGLDNVKFLSIRSMFFGKVEHISAVVSLITSYPKLQTLIIENETMNNVVEPVVQFLPDQSILYGVMKLLQRVHINMFSGLEMEMEFVRFILVCAPVLEKISFMNLSCFLHLPSRQLVNKMKQFHRASPNVEFIFEEIGVDD